MIVCWVHAVRARFNVACDWWRCPFGCVVLTAEAIYRNGDPWPVGLFNQKRF